jgi:hypothetical protein
MSALCIDVPVEAVLLINSVSEVLIEIQHQLILLYLVQSSVQRA